MTDGQHNDHQHLEFDPDDYPYIADPISPCTGEVGFQRLSLRTRIIERRNAFRQVAKHPTTIGTGQSLQVLFSPWFETDGPGPHLSFGPRSSA